MKMRKENGLTDVMAHTHAQTEIRRDCVALGQGAKSYFWMAKAPWWRLFATFKT